MQVQLGPNVLLLVVRGWRAPGRAAGLGGAWDCSSVGRVLPGGVPGCQAGVSLHQEVRLLSFTWDAWMHSTWRQVLH